MNTRSVEIYWVLAGLLAAVSLASAIAYALQRRQPANPSIENLNTRIRAWWVLILAGGAALLAGRIALIVLFACVSFLALREFLARFPGRRRDSPALWICCVLTLAAQYLLIGSSSEQFLICIPVYGFLALAVTAVLFTGIQGFLERIAISYWGLMACVYCISHIPALMSLRIPGREDTRLLIVFVVLISQISDISQYLWGKLIGRHPVAPVLSPKKTVEGLAGGLFTATLIGALLRPITPFSAWQAGLMALLIAVLGFFSGLVMSAIKRERGIKDWGNLITGHGGMLDRVDSLCFSAPAFFHLVKHFFRA